MRSLHSKAMKRTVALAAQQRQVTRRHLFCLDCLIRSNRPASAAASEPHAREQGSALGLSPKVHSYAGIDLVRFLFGGNNKRLKPGHNVRRVVENKDSKYTSCLRCRTRRSHQRLRGCENQVERGLESACNLSWQ